MLTKLENDRVTAACRLFGHTSVRSITRLPSTFNSAYGVQCPSGRFLLKQRSASESNSLRKEVAVARVLRRVGVPCPTPVSAKTGELACNIGGNSYSMFEFLDAERPTSGPEDVAMITAALATLHLQTSSDMARSWLLPIVGSLTTCQWADRQSKLLLSTLDGFLPSGLSELHALLLDAIHAITAESGPGAGTVSLIHWDLHVGNTLIDRASATVYLLDFEHALMDANVADLANSLLLLVLLDGGAINYSAPMTFVQSVEVRPCSLNRMLSSYASVFPLREYESLAMPYYMIVAWIGWCLYTFLGARFGDDDIGRALRTARALAANKDAIITSCRCFVTK